MYLVITADFNPLMATLTACWLVSEQRNAVKNADKTKEMVVSFSKKFPAADLPPISICGKELERISCAKILGVWISCDLSWNAYVDYICPMGTRESTSCVPSGELVHPPQICSPFTRQLLEVLWNMRVLSGTLG